MFPKEIKVAVEYWEEHLGMRWVQGYKIAGEGGG